MSPERTDPIFGGLHVHQTQVDVDPRPTAPCWSSYDVALAVCGHPHRVLGHSTGCLLGFPRDTALSESWAEAQPGQPESGGHAVSVDRRDARHGTIAAGLRRVTVTMCLSSVSEDAAQPTHSEDVGEIRKVLHEVIQNWWFDLPSYVAAWQVLTERTLKAGITTTVLERSA